MEAAIAISSFLKSYSIVYGSICFWSSVFFDIFRHVIFCFQKCLNRTRHKAVVDQDIYITHNLLANTKAADDQDTYILHGRSSLIYDEKDHHYFLNRFVCAREFFDG